MDDSANKDRLCQFFLRGRCNRENCEFKHDSTKLQKPAEAPVVAVKSSAPPVRDEEASKVEESVKETSTFLAATADEQPSTPLLVRRARPAASASEIKNGASEEGFEDILPSKDLESPNKLNEKTLEESVQAPVRDSVSNGDQEEVQAPKDTFSDQVPAPTETVPEELMVEDRKNATKMAELSKEWDEEEKKGEEDQGETIESIESFIQEKPSQDKEKPDSQEPKEGEKSKEEWVTAIFGEEKQEQQQTPPPKGKKSVYDLNPEGEDFSVNESTPFTAIQPKTEESAKKAAKPGLTKSSGVTKIGNNTYFYSGPKSKADQELEEDEEDEEMEEEGDEGPEEPQDEEDDTMEHEEQPDDSLVETVEAKPAKVKRKLPGKGYAEGRRKHSTSYVYGARSTAAKTRRCGECEGCNREDCGKCNACIDKPKFGGKGAKKQACLYRMCTWKNPSGKRIVPGSAPIAAPPVVPPTPPRSRSSKKAEATPKSEPKRGRKSISVISPATVTKQPSDSELPAFDPDKFKPGYTPPVVKKGEDEYAIIVSGVKDTGLCGKYWSDMDNLPPRRRRTTMEAAKAEESQSPANSESASKKRPSRKQSLKEKMELEDDKEEASKRAAKKRKADEIQDDALKSPPAKRDAKDGEEQMDLIKMPSKADSKQDSLTKMEAGSANRSVSCVAADSTQREVVVECFAPYDDHRWVNIGKERDGMAPDAVQYARALRPPYHLLSFLRIKGHSTKGMSCTDKNTMVFVVLEGEITVVLHTTQFNAKKGDSFYIPPKNYYNLINQKAREAELSLIQFQYDGPLPTVAAASQSGVSKP